MVILHWQRLGNGSPYIACFGVQVISSINSALSSRKLCNYVLKSVLALKESNKTQTKEKLL